MTYAEKLVQEKAYKEYQKHLAEQFAQSEDGEFEISESESKDFEHLHIDNQSLENADAITPNQDS